MKNFIKNTLRLSGFLCLGFAAQAANAQTCSYSDFNEHHTYVGSYNACIYKIIQTVDCTPLENQKQNLSKLKKVVFAVCGQHAGDVIEKDLRAQKADPQTRLNCHRDFGEYIVSKRDDVFAFNLEDKQKECKNNLKIQKDQANTPRPSNGNGAYLDQGVL